MTLDQPEEVDKQQTLQRVSAKIRGGKIWPNGLHQNGIRTNCERAGRHISLMSVRYNRGFHQPAWEKHIRVWAT